ncbi:MAG: nucleotidyltransferase family protein [Fretibacterium sp.]|nr:nucleotidyltransferase family protein [Fretibacterium sp.]
MPAVSAPIVGIVAEYNPLHNGHRLMLESARSRLGDDVPCVIVLSSNFTQRGEPALCDKWTRAEMALQCGADLVLELPFLFSCAAAPDFSAGAVDLLARTHLATHIAFGMEDPETDIAPIINLLLHEPPPFKQRLQEEMKRGASFPKAIAETLDAFLAGAGPFASSPNNLLGLSYLLRIKRQDYSLCPLPLPRVGKGHGEMDLGPLASAEAIRAALRQGSTLDDNGLLAAAMPASSLALLRGAEKRGRLCASSKRLWPLLQALFLRSASDSLHRVDGMDEGIENLFLKHWRDAVSLDDFVGRCVSSRYTQGHIRRRLVRLLLGVDRWTAQAVRRTGVPYARVLGFTARGRKLLKTQGHASEIPLISRLGAVKGTIGKSMVQMEFRASALYELLLPHPDLQHEKRQCPLM